MLSIRRFLSSMTRNGHSALLIVAHGSTVNPDSSAPTLAHAAEIRRRKIFADVECAFWKEEPSLRDAKFLFDSKSIREVCVVPNFISEGYFTQTVIPRELELNGDTTKRASGQIWKYCQPVGNHPAMTELLLKRAREVALGVDPAETSLLIVAHGTDLNENSAVAAKREAEKIRALGKFAGVLNVYMEEPPLVSDWRKLTNTRNVVVVPFFISDGLHSYEDIPRLVGIANGRSTIPSHAAHAVRFSGAIRTSSTIASCFMRHRSAPILVSPISSLTRQALQKVKIALALGFFLRKIAVPRMKETTCKKLQEIGAFALAGGCTRKRMKQLVEMIRAARHYRWLAVYKIVKDEFVILAATGNEPPTYPQFPITQGLCGAALDSGKPIIVGDVHKDPRHLPAFHTTRSEIVVPMRNNDHKRILGMMDVESDKLNAFSEEDRAISGARRRSDRALFALEWRATPTRSYSRLP